MGKTDWTQLWLTYHRVFEGNCTWETVLEGFTASDAVVSNALSEFKRGMDSIGCDSDSMTLKITKSDAVPAEGYSIKGDDNGILLEASDERGLLYGVFAILRQTACGKRAAEVNETASPSNPLRMMNHWDNMDGSIERGYSGESFFFENEEIVINDRTVDYARFMASIGINGVVINNVNVKGAASY
ncbi:MAG: alpha-glucuronidase, partial [Butyrivibrio sp.]|nr:alpha-glucuronidase [Butyrivibrio sp.]